MHKFVTDKAFDLEKTFEYILSIQVSLDGFSFSIVCPTENKLLAFQHSALKISSESLITRRFEDWLDSSNIFSNSFKKVQLIVLSRNFTLIPKKYFNRNLKEEVSNLLFENNTDTELVENELVDQNSKVVFSLPKGMHRVVTNQFGEYEVIHPIKFVLKHKAATNKKYCLKLIVETNNFYTILLSENKTKLANSFTYKHKNDLIFYILTLLKQLSVSPKETLLVFSGKLEEETLSDLAKYFEETSPLEVPNSIKVSSDFNTTELQNNFTLFS